MSITYEDIVKWWQSQRLITTEDYKVTLYNFQIIFASNTNSIEGSAVNYYVAKDVFNNSNLSNYSGNVTDLFYVRNQKFACEFILQALVRNAPITSTFVKRLHKILMYGCYDDKRWRRGERPGEFKHNDYCVGTSDVGSYPDEVSDDLNALLNELRTTDITDAVVAGAYFHAAFESIHPFADGNGRVGRTLLNYFLMSHNLPPLVIFDSDKMTYYMALEVYNRTGELSGFVQFLKEQTIKTWSHKLQDNSKKLEWCRNNAPAALSNLSDDELLQIMDSAYTKYCNTF